MLVQTSTKSSLRITAFIMLGSSIAYYILHFIFGGLFTSNLLLTFMLIQVLASLTLTITSIKRYYAGAEYQFIVAISALFATLIFFSIMILYGFSDPDVSSGELQENIVLASVQLLWISTAVHYITKIVSVV